MIKEVGSSRSCSAAQSCPTLCNSMESSWQASLDLLRRYNHKCACVPMTELRKADGKKRKNREVHNYT